MILREGKMNHAHFSCPWVQWDLSCLKAFCKAEINPQILSSLMEGLESGDTLGGS